MNVIRSVASEAISAGWSSAGMMTDVPPTWAQLGPMSAGIPRRAMFWVLVRNASCVVGTPLGCPVLPEV
jgi:hypothetical protein